MHACFTDAEAMRFWDRTVYAKRVETERHPSLRQKPPVLVSVLGGGGYRDRRLPGHGQLS